LSLKETLGWQMVSEVDGSMTDLFKTDPPQPTREAFSHAGIAMQRLFVHNHPPLSVAR